ncbi:flagellin C [Aureimonas flava]|uniref:Flagellin n=1 Tax=Aureimonas flava TaxID=2320271 RepID=A0A3A1WUW1_9HYPH|nr:flagellin [Aureimonas flava]RIY02441.1 flagellin C [Aureimonas flava]
MSSVNFNAAATSALRTLQQTNSALDSTQSRISTGLKIGEAKDNAAYWSISTTLKSDNKAISTVSDALSLGAATVDTAYQGLNATLSVLDEIKSKLTAATQDGVDKSAVQSEIAELQKQLKSIASSATFSGENWLSVNTSTNDYSSSKTVVSSFTRDASGSVSLGSIGIDISKIALFDANGAGEGILDSGKLGNTATGGLSNVYAAGTAASPATSGGFTSGVIDVSGLAVGDHVTFNLAIDGAAAAPQNVTLTAGAGGVVTLASLASDLNAIAGITVGVDDSGTKLVFASSTASGTSNVAVDTFAYTDSVPAAKTPSPATGLADQTGTAGKAAVNFAAAAATVSNFSGPITLDSNDTIMFNVAVDGGASKLVTISKSTVDAALSSTDGVITTDANFLSVMQQALTDAGVTGVTADLNGTAVRLTSAATSGASSVSITDVSADKGSGVTSIDITDKSAAQITAYINTVNTAMNAITAGASNLGAVAARIDLQKTFVTNLMDTIDKGVSGLVDADMNEESTKLQALQVKQQLGVQALSIANQSAQNVLRLFQ